jgi:mRNA interferase MazF
VNRGEIWWVDFGAPFGSESGYERPALVLQVDAFNRSLIQTVVPFSTNKALALAPGNVLWRPRQTVRGKARVANVSQIAVIDRARRARRAGVLARRSWSRSKRASAGCWLTDA